MYAEYILSNNVRGKKDFLFFSILRCGVRDDTHSNTKNLTKQVPIETKTAILTILKSNSSNSSSKTKKNVAKI